MFKPWPKIPRLENEVYHITEKIDGTNAAVLIWEQDGESVPRIAAQSRTRIITPENDNFGFAKWVQSNAEQLIADLGVGYHFGEWWGLGINRGYDLDHKRFSLFNPTEQSSVCFNVPLMGSMPAFNQEDDWLCHYTDVLKNGGSLAAPGYMRPEGFIIYAEKAKTYWKVIMDK